MEPFHYATFAPAGQTYDNNPAPPVLPTVVDGMPPDFFGVPLFSGSTMKTQLSLDGATAALVPVAIADAKLARAKTFADLVQLFPDQGSLGSKQAAVVGNLPTLDLGAEGQFVVLPPQILPEDVAGSVTFPFRQGNAPPMLCYPQDNPRPTEKLVGQVQMAMYSLLAMILILFITFVVSRRLQSQSIAEENEEKRIRRSLMRGYPFGRARYSAREPVL